MVDEMYAPDALHSLLPRADIVMLNAALTSGTRFMMGRTEFSMMKRGAAFINMSRGGLVDPKALEEALRTDHISGAIVDVTFPEPLAVGLNFVGCAQSDHHASCFVG